MSSKVVSLYTSKNSLPSTANRAVSLGSSSIQAPKKFTITSVTSLTVNGATFTPSFVFPYSPNEVNLDNVGLAYDEVMRPSRKPLLLTKQEKLYQVSAKFLITSKVKPFIGGIRDDLLTLELFANLDADVMISYPGIPTDMMWRITEYSLRSVRRNESNEVIIAEASITFRESTYAKTKNIVPGMLLIKDIPTSYTNTSKADDGPPDPDDGDVNLSVERIILAGDDGTLRYPTSGQIGIL